MGNIAVALIQRALEVSPELAGTKLRVRMRAGRLTISGVVDFLREKRTALLLAREISFGERLVDRIEVATSAVDDREIAGDLLEQLSLEPELNRAIVHVGGPGFDGGARIPFPKPAARLAFWIERGIVRISGIAADTLRRGLAEGIAWSIAGVRDVRPLFRVQAPRPEDEASVLACARRLIARDPMLGECARLIDSWCSNGELTLSGIVPGREQRDRAEHDAWAVDGVRAVAVDLRVLHTGGEWWRGSDLSPSGESVG